MSIQSSLKPFRENSVCAAIVALPGCCAGLAWVLSGKTTETPSALAFILSAGTGVVCALASWAVFSAVFARIFKQPTNSVRRIEAIAHLSILLYLPAALNLGGHMEHLSRSIAIVTLIVFTAAKVAEIIYFALPRKIGIPAAIVFIAVAGIFITGHAKTRLLGNIDYWQDREEIFAENETPAFSGPGAKSVFVNAQGQWRRATKLKPPGVYRFTKKLENPSRLSIGFLAMSSKKGGAATIEIIRPDAKPRRIDVRWEGSDWKNVYIDGDIPAGELELRVIPRSGEMWVSDPVLTWGFERPNVIFIVIDALRADHLSCYGYPRRTSPAIDGIAEKGVLFERHYSPSSWSTAAMASLFTGLYPRQHGCIDFGSLVLPSELETFPEAFKRAGYRTVGVSGNALLSVKTNFAQGFDRFDETCFYSINWRSGECVTDRGAAAVGKGGPLLLYLHYMDPHMPYAAPPPDLMRWRDWPYTTGPSGLVRFIANRYDEMISYSDRQVGLMLEHLAVGGLLENSFVIITADHGEELGDHGGYNHGYTVFEEVVHVPLIITGPGVPRGMRYKYLSSGVDIFPTLGVKTPAYLPGKSLFPITDASDREIIADAIDQTALITPNYKFIVDTSSGRRLLFDLDSDPTESDNLADKKPRVVKEAYRKLQEIIDELSRVKPPSRRSQALMKQLRNRLKALGYVE